MQSYKSYFSRADIMKQFWWKWLVCFWLHYRYRCYEQRRGWFEHWHCKRCHDCGEAMDILLKWAEEQIKLQKQIDVLTPSNADLLKMTKRIKPDFVG